MCSIFIYMDHLMGFLVDIFRKTGKVMGEHGIKGSKNFLDLDYFDALSILDENLSKMNELLEVLRVEGARTGLKED